MYTNQACVCISRFIPNNMSHSIYQIYPISLRVNWIVYFMILYYGKSSLSELEWLVIRYSGIYIV